MCANVGRRLKLQPAQQLKTQHVYIFSLQCCLAATGDSPSRLYFFAQVPSMPPKYKNLTNDERKAVLWFLQAKAKEENKNGLQRGAIAEAATHFNKKHVTIQRIWNRAKTF